MGRKRRIYTAAEKARVALAAVRGEGTLSELASRFQVHRVQVAKWKRQLLAQAAEVFGGGGKGDSGEQERLVAELYQEIGRLRMKLECLKKAAPFDCNCLPGCRQIDLARNGQVVAICTSL